METRNVENRLERLLYVYLTDEDGREAGIFLEPEELGQAGPTKIASDQHHPFARLGKNHSQVGNNRGLALGPRRTRYQDGPGLAFVPGKLKRRSEGTKGLGSG